MTAGSDSVMPAPSAIFPARSFSRMRAMWLLIIAVFLAQRPLPQTALLSAGISSLANSSMLRSQLALSSQS